MPKRAAEFIAGRLAAHAALAELRALDPTLPSALLVLAASGEQRGRPVLVTAGLEPVAAEVSISHLDPIAVAIAARERVAIDLVAIEAQSSAFVAEAFRPEELDAWATGLGLARTDPRVIAHAFAAKEAVLKWLGRGFGLPLRAVASAPAEPLPPSGPARTELIAELPSGRRRLPARRWFEGELVALALFTPARS